MMSLNYYLTKASQGDSKAAYEAAKVMEYSEYNNVIVQAQLRRAASLGSIDAMRWLGFLGLAGKLIHPDSSVSNTTYYKGYNQAYKWFNEGAISGDAISAFVASKCLQLGVGTPQDEVRAEGLMKLIIEKVPEELFLPIICLLDSITHKATTKNHAIDTEIVKQLLAS